MRKRKQLGNITHRDGRIVTQALAFAIEGLGATKWPQLSNIEDMKEILAFMLDLEPKLMTASCCLRTGVKTKRSLSWGDCLKTLIRRPRRKPSPM
jgi:hypothetical protein